MTTLNDAVLWTHLPFSQLDFEPIFHPSSEVSSSVAQHQHAAGGSTFAARMVIDAFWLTNDEHRGKIVELSDKKQDQWVCNICKLQFQHAKTLSRHKGAVHGQPRYKCVQCGKVCTRRDILLRHIREQHSDEDVMVQCKQCGEEVRSRRMRSHLSSSACKNAEAQNGVHPGQALARTHRTYATHLATPTYLDAPADPIMLAAELMFKVKPWGPGHWLGRTPDEAPQTVAVGVLELKDVLYRAILKAIKSATFVRDPYIADAIGLLIIIAYELEGWEACRTHICGFVTAVKMHIAARDAFRSTPLPDVFRTVALRNVAKPVVSKYDDMLVMVMTMLRCAGADLTIMSTEQLHVLDERLWFQENRERLLPIAEMASALEK